MFLHFVCLQDLLHALPNFILDLVSGKTTINPRLITEILDSLDVS